MVSNWCQSNLKALENKGDLKQMKLGIVVHAPVSYKSMYPYKSL